MNKNSTQKKTRNFVTKISDFFKIVSTLPAYLRTAADFILVQLYHLTVFQSFFKAIAASFFGFSNYHKRFLLPEYSQNHLIPGRVLVSRSSSDKYNFSPNTKAEPGVSPVIINQY